MSARPSGDELVWLVDCLNKVRRHVAPPCSPLIPLEVLDGLHRSCPAFRQCLRKLGNMHQGDTSNLVRALYPPSRHWFRTVRLRKL